MQIYIYIFFCLYLFLLLSRMDKELMCNMEINTNLLITIVNHFTSVYSINRHYLNLNSLKRKKFLNHAR